MKNLILLSFLLPAVALGQAFAPSGNAASATNFTGSLSGDVTGTQSATVVSTVSGVTAANVAAGANLANAATDANTASTIVKRDASGNFSAGTITASLTGTASGNPTGSGANTRMAFWTGAGTLSSDADFTWDSTNNILTIAPAILGSKSIILDNQATICFNGTTCSARVWSSSGQLVLTNGAGSDMLAQMDTGSAFSSVGGLTAGQQLANQATLRGSSSNSPITITASGGGSNLGISLVGTGTGAVTGTAAVTAGNALANQLSINGSAASSAATITATGSDSSISINLVPKGSGTVTATTFTGALTGTASGNITALTGDVTASGGGSQAATVALVAGSTAANVHAAELLANAATLNNTASTIVKRGGSGEFSAGIVTSASGSGANAFVMTEGAHLGISGAGGSYIAGDAATHGITYLSNVTANNTSVAHYFNTNNNQTDATDFLAQFDDNNSFRFALQANGKLRFPVSQTYSVVGTATLTGGTVTVSTTAVTANSQIFLTHRGSGTAANFGILSVGTITGATSFVINSGNVLDADTISWFVIN